MKKEDLKNFTKDEIQKLKLELEELKKLNSSACDIYGSELCASDMLNKEKQLEDKIKKLENELL